MERETSARVPAGPFGRAQADAVAAVLAAVFTLVMLGQGGLGSTEAEFRSLDALGVVLAVASAAPLLVLRRFPGLVYVVTAVASLGLVALHYPLDVPPGPLIATYALAEAVGGTDRGLRWPAAVGVAAFLPIGMTMLVLHGKTVSGLTAGMAAWAAMFALVWIAGDRSRLRRERIAELEVQARLRHLEIQTQRRLAAAQERTRIARELHDSAGHAINVILVQAGAARLLHDRDAEGSRRAIETIEEVALSTISDIDRLVHALREEHTTAVPAPGDTAALEQLVDRHRAGGLQVATSFHGAPRGLPSGVAWAAYRILQEALTNAARHGSGSARVLMSYGPAAVEIEVSNPVADRRGRPGGGMGIVGMRERAALLDGTLEAETEAGAFRLRACLPYLSPGASIGATA